MEPQENFFQRKAASEAAIYEIVKMLAEDFGRDITITVSVECETVQDWGGCPVSCHAKEPQITTIVK